MDLVYVVRIGDDNEELRYSLRSLVNLPEVTSVTVVGDYPKWMVPDLYIPGNPRRQVTWENGPENLKLAVASEETPDEFYLMNDDFFVTQPLEEIPVLHRGSILDHLRSRSTQFNRYSLSLKRTQQQLVERGYPHPRDYEVHAPLLVNKAGMAEVIELFGEYQNNKWPRQYRSLYGNYHGIGGVKVVDPKIPNENKLREPFHSCNDHTFPLFQPQLHQLFPEPSRFER